jgi:hypothetical protein
MHILFIHVYIKGIKDSSHWILFICKAPKLKLVDKLEDLVAKKKGRGQCSKTILKIIKVCWKFLLLTVI